MPCGDGRGRGCLGCGEQNPNDITAEASLNAASEESVRVHAERQALIAQRNNLILVAPIDGLITARNADSRITLVAGQAVVELIDPQSLWINVRFDQNHARGLSANLAAQIAAGALTGRVLRVEPLADEVTEEMLAGDHRSGGGSFAGTLPRTAGKKDQAHYHRRCRAASSGGGLPH